MEELNKLKKMRTRSIVGIVLIFTLFFAIVSVILAIVDGIIILSNDWEKEKLNKDKILWGVLCLVVLGNVSSLVFSIKGINLYKNDSNKNKEQITTISNS